MEEKNKYTYFEVRVWGEFAMFTDPVTRTSGEKISYPIPVYSALKGIMESVYFDPAIQWVIDNCRIMNPILMEAMWFCDRYRGDRVLQNYLSCCEYQVRAHMKFNNAVYKMEEQRDIRVCIKMARNALKVGGRRYAFLGTKKCPAYVETQSFGTGEGYYDKSGERVYGLMFHSYEYPEHNRQHELKVRFWRPKMIDGIIHYCLPGQCDYIRTLRAGTPYVPMPKKQRGERDGHIIII